MRLRKVAAVAAATGLLLTGSAAPAMAKDKKPKKGQLTEQQQCEARVNLGRSADRADLPTTVVLTSVAARQPVVEARRRARRRPERPVPLRMMAASFVPR